ncbi:MAG: hypothetical protein MJA84_18060 [Firmicutes bacterium]|nr:hypothetical protein [Bacillota bacterium]
MYGLLGQPHYSSLLGRQPWFWGYRHAQSGPSFASGRAGDIQRSFYGNYGLMPSDYQVGGIGLIADLLNAETQERSHARLLKPQFYENFGDDPLRYL